MSRGFRGGSGILPPTVVPTPTTKTGKSRPRASPKRSRHLAAPRLAVGDQHEGLRVRRFSVELLVLLDEPHAPGDAQLDVRVPGRVVLEPERRFAVQVVEEEEERVGVAREPHLRRRDVREERHRNPVVAPRQRFAEHAQKPHRALPAIAGHIRRPHRRRAVLQDDEVDAGRAHQRRGRDRPRQRDNRARARGDETEPEDQVAEDRKPFPHRQSPMLAVAPRITPSRRELPHPDDQQHPGRNQQPQKLRLREPHAVEIEAREHSAIKNLKSI